VRNHILLLRGINATQQFSKRQKQMMQKDNKIQKVKAIESKKV